MEETGIFRNLFLFALPASGKSEIRKFLEKMSQKQRREEMHIGEMVELDDFPFVHLLRVIDEALVEMGKLPVFSPNPEEPFFNPEVVWPMLTHLLAVDYKHLLCQRSYALYESGECGYYMLSEIAYWYKMLGRGDILGENCDWSLVLSADELEKLSESIDDECRDVLNEKDCAIPSTLEGKTIIIEFSRGGSEDDVRILTTDFSAFLPFGYRAAFPCLTPVMLEDAAILYVGVSPEESRKRNLARFDPNDPNGTLGHMVPEKVMRECYAGDDIRHLLELTYEQRGPKDTIEVTLDILRTLPCVVFDNETDLTSFTREKKWPKDKREVLHFALREALEKLWSARTKIKS